MKKRLLPESTVQEIPHYWTPSCAPGIPDTDVIPRTLRFCKPPRTGGFFCYGVACKIVNFAMLVPSALMQSMASFVSQNVGAGKSKRAKKSMFTGIEVGLVVGCFVFALVFLKGDVLSGFFSTDADVIQNGFAYLKGFAPETILTAVLFSMIGYFNGNDKTLWVMTQGLIRHFGPSANGIHHEYPAECQPDKDRSCCTGFYSSWNYVKRWILCLFKSEKNSPLQPLPPALQPRRRLLRRSLRRNFQT